MAKPIANTLDRVRSIVADQLDRGTADIGSETKLIDDLGADSLEAIEIMMAIEEEFDIEITDAEIEGVLTVADLVAIVERKHG